MTESALRMQVRQFVLTEARRLRETRNTPPQPNPAATESKTSGDAFTAQFGLKHDDDPHPLWDEDRFAAYVDRETDATFPFAQQIWEDQGASGPLTEDQYATACLRQANAQTVERLSEFERRLDRLVHPDPAVSPGQLSPKTSA